jgi:hypothetical protein
VRNSAPGICVRGALVDKLRSTTTGEQPWLKTFGELRGLCAETARVERIIQEKFETIDAEDY